MQKHKWWALSALALSGLVVGLDLTVLNVALPTLATELHATTSDLQWFANAYNLVFAALLLPAGLLADRFDRKKLLLGALLLFGAASLACAYAPSVEALIAGRVALGVGAAFLLPLGIAMITVLFGPAERPKATAFIVVANMLGIPLGPIVGGLLLDSFWWGSVFLITIPLILLALAAVWALLPTSRSPQPPYIHIPGILASSFGLAGITYGLIQGGVAGWTSVGVLGALLGGAAALVVFGVWEYRAFRSQSGKSLIDLSLFRSAHFTWGTILAVLITFAMFGLLFTMPQYFHAVNGADALSTGIRLLPFIGGLLIGAKISELLLRRLGLKIVVALGFIIAAVGLMIGAVSSLSEVSDAVRSGAGFIAFWLAIVGFGSGLAMPAAMGAALAVLPAARSGMGGAVIQAFRQVGGTLGVAILGALLSAMYVLHVDVSQLPLAAAEVVQGSAAGGVLVASELGSDQLLQSVRSAFVHATGDVLLLSGWIAVLGCILALLFLPRKVTSVSAVSSNGDEER